MTPHHTRAAQMLAQLAEAMTAKNITGKVLAEKLGIDRTSAQRRIKSGGEDLARFIATADALGFEVALLERKPARKEESKPDNDTVTVVSDYENKIVPYAC